MFGLFKKSAPDVSVEDKIWLSSAEKRDAVREMYKVNPDCLFIVWFEGSLREYREALGFSADSQNLKLVDRVGPSDLSGKMTIFLEHYPLSEVEQHYFKRLGLTDVPVLSAMDEPIFDLFGGERVRDMMRRLGMQKGEIVAHQMINASIRRAQQKISTKVKTEKKALSAAEWFKINMGK